MYITFVVCKKNSLRTVVNRKSVTDESLHAVHTVIYNYNFWHILINEIYKQSLLVKLNGIDG